MPMDLVDRFLRPLRGGPLTRRYPDEQPVLPSTTRGLPEVDPSRCDANAACVTACPTGAISVGPGGWTVDTGRCVFCGICATACPQDAIRLGARFDLAATSLDATRVTTRIGDQR
jgi:formate hydrogenlyase subunit 6/NADH:ubiquinone oxidoreductase subunit I